MIVICCIVLFFTLLDDLSALRQSFCHLNAEIRPNSPLHTNKSWFPDRLISRFRIVFKWNRNLSIFTKTAHCRNSRIEYLIRFVKNQFNRKLIEQNIENFRLCSIEIFPIICFDRPSLRPFHICSHFLNDLFSLSYFQSLFAISLLHSHHISPHTPNGKLRNRSKH